MDTAAQEIRVLDIEQSYSYNLIKLSDLTIIMKLALQGIATEIDSKDIVKRADTVAENIYVPAISYLLNEINRTITDIHIQRDFLKYDSLEHITDYNKIVEMILEEYLGLIETPAVKINPLKNKANRHLHTLCCQHNYCKSCSSKVSTYNVSINFNSNSKILEERPESVKWPWWQACDNADCENAYGSGITGQYANWVCTKPLESDKK